MPAGAVFPFDFGFIPDTKGGDGDRLDVLVIMDEPAYPGCVVECRIIGALKAKPSEKKKMKENDRLIAVSIVFNSYSDVEGLKDVNKIILDEIEHFFILIMKRKEKHLNHKAGPIQRRQCN